MSIPSFEDIITPNDQTEARKASLDAIAALVGNVYPNKFVRSSVSGVEDTITALKHFEKVADIEARMAEIKASLGEGERPPADKKDVLNEELKALGTVRLAGRLTTPTRGNFVHLTDGKSKLQVYTKKGGFNAVHNDSQDLLDSPDSWTVWQLLDHGDLIGVEGYLFVTNTGEVSVHVEKLQFLAKAMLPMPDKMHGIADAEIRQRQRYVDLIGSSLQIENEGLTTRETFERRAKIISSMRHFLEDHGYVEVETPMLTPKATGAAAKPFETHHNALDIKLYARIAPELYLKRLVVGGFEKVYELNRNFRNEGISYKHNPEFTMLEFYCAYMDVNGMIDFCAQMLSYVVDHVTGGSVIEYEENRIDFGKFERVNRAKDGDDNGEGSTTAQVRRMSMKESIIELAKKNPSVVPIDFDPSWMDDSSKVVALAEYTNFVQYSRNIISFAGVPGEKPELITFDRRWNQEEIKNFRESHPSWPEVHYQQWGGDELEKLWDLKNQSSQLIDVSEEDKNNALSLLLKSLDADRWEEVVSKTESRIVSSNEAERGTATIFENVVESELIQPTFIVDYPKSISPLSKASPDNPQVAERFELFINGMEVANGFSELNDPKEQYERFVDQMSERERGDEEAMVLDEDYIRALSYGMPPAAGIGIGIDRLVMLLTNKHSIRDVILFPHMRPEKNNSATEDTESTEGN